MRASLAIIVVLASLCLWQPLHAADAATDNFDAGVTQWAPEMRYGDVSGCKASVGDGKGGSGALRVDYVFAAQGTNHIIYARPVKLDLSWSNGISFDVKGVGDQVAVFLFIWDSKGRFNNYGPHGTNRDFYTGYADWYTCRVDFDTDRSVQGGDADLSDIRKVGFMLNDSGVSRGTVWFDDLTALDAQGTLVLRQKTFSPNGDGVYDTLPITVYAPRDARATVQVLGARGEVVTTLAREVPQEKRRVDLAWGGKRRGRVLPDGQYTVRATFRNAQTTEFAVKAGLDTSHRWPPLHYRAKPFFPIGLWFEGSPANAKYPADPGGAARYYDRCFADMHAHGFNAVAVPNCPEPLWETLLQSAQGHEIKVVLEIQELAAFVRQPEAPAESDVYAVAKRIVSKVGKYDSLLRYQIQDEPSPQMMPNWLLVQRIVAALDPKRPAFSCHCVPDSLAIAAAKPGQSEVVFDIYPLGQGTPLQSLGDFLPVLDMYVALAKGNPPWAVLQAFATPGGWRNPTPEELRAMTYLSLATGTKGVFYFIYQYMPDYLWGLVEVGKDEKPLYAPTSQLAQELGKLSPLLLSLKPARPLAAPDENVRVGGFEDAQRRPVLIVASRRPDRDVSVALDVSTLAPWQDALTGEIIPAEAGVLVLRLPAGAGKVLVRM